MSIGELRSQYERSVLALRSRCATMRLEGLSAEVIARALHAERRRLAAEFKARTPEPLRSRIYERTFAVYGDALGPTVEGLRARRKSWDDILSCWPMPAASLSASSPTRWLREQPRTGVL